MYVEGLNGHCQLFEDRVVILRKGLRGAIFSGPKETTIPLSQLGSIEFEQPGFNNGHIEFVRWGMAPKKGWMHIANDENIVVFTKKQQASFQQLKSAVEERIAAHPPPVQTSIATDEADVEEWMTSLREGRLSLKFAIEGGKSEVILKANEELHMLLPNIALWEARSIRTSTGGYAGPTIRVAKGVSFRVGAFKAQSSSHTDLREIDRGRLTLTNHRLVFTGTQHTSEINLAKITSIEPYRDGIAVQASGRTKTQCFVGIDPTKVNVTVKSNERTYDVPFTGSILECMIEGLIKKEQDAHSQPAPKGAVGDIPEQIRQLNKLREEGILTAEEFEKKKAELLDRM
jgi:hypothetical protein